MQNVSTLQNRLCSLVLFRALLQDGAVSAFMRLRLSEQADEKTAIAETASFTAALFDKGDNLSDYVLNLVLEDENAYIRRAGEGAFTDAYRQALDTELSILQDLCDLTPEDVRAFTGITLPFPAWQNTPYDLHEIYAQRVRDIGKVGYGIFAKYHMFSLKDGKIAPVKHPDEQRLSDFSGL